MKSFIVFFSLILIFSLPCAVMADRPMLGAAGLSSDSARGTALLSAIERNLSAASFSSGVFDPVNSDLLHDQLLRFGCSEERCLTGFAHDAKIAVLIICSVRDDGENLKVSFKGFGTEFPFNGKTITEKTYALHLKKRASQQEQLSCAEELSISFFSSLLHDYRRPVSCTAASGHLTSSENTAGRCEVISSEGISSIRSRVKSFGFFDFSGGSALSPDLPDGQYLLLEGYQKKGEDLLRFLRGRKKEIVFTSPSYGETVFTFALAPVISAATPLLAPLGYYTYDDYTGLGLWAANYAPWAYLSWKGYSGGFPAMHDQRSSASADSVAQHYFFWYMLCAGNLPLFADAAAHTRLEDVSVYETREQYLGNTATAVVLSIAGGGGGMFYRGYRGWGYFYFQADNILLYYTIRSICSSRDRDHSGISLGDVKRGRSCVFFAGSFIALKAFEIVHVILSDDRIDAADEVAGDCTVVPSLECTGSQKSVTLAVRYVF
jgi:hypothetical protein